MKLVYQDNQITLYHGDCLEVMADMAAESIDAIITDPPYGIDYQSAWRIDPGKRHEKIANDKAPFIWWLYDAFRVTRSPGSLTCFCRWDVQEAFRAAIEWAGFEIKSKLVWDRGAHGMGDLRASFGPVHDEMWFAIKGEYAFPGKRPISLFRAARLGGNELVHPNQKPVWIMEQIIESVTVKDALILDPFSGSGTTLIAALNLGRKAIGIEIDEKWISPTIERIKAWRKKGRLALE